MGMNNLLHKIQLIAQCQYLSDLHFVRLTDENRFMISRIPDEDYTLAQWNQAVSYIVGNECSFKTISAAKKKINDYNRL